MSRPMALSLYSAATRAVSPALPLLLSRRVRSGKEDPKRLNERLATNLSPRGNQPIVWLHGASVGETMMLARIVNVLAAARPEARCIVTTQTLTAADMLKRRLPASVAQQQMAPFDGPAIIERFLDHWKPDLAVFAEGEIWPNMLMEASKREIPLALINARMTRESIENWMRFQESARTLFRKFSFIGAADKLTTLGLEQILGEPVKSPGNLKLDAPAPSVDTAELAKLSAQIGDRRVWLVASSHSGDEAFCIAAHAVIRAKEPNALLIIAPRHANRAEEICKLIPGSVPFARRSRNEAITPQTSVYLADTMGELGLLFSLAPVTVMGGGFKTNIGGHNPIEPARLGTYVFSGPYVHNFKEAYAAIEENGAGRLITCESPRDLANAILVEWAEPRTREDLAAQNAAWLPAPDAALAATIEELLALAPLTSRSLSPDAKNATA